MRGIRSAAASISCADCGSAMNHGEEDFSTQLFLGKVGDPELDSVRKRLPDPHHRLARLAAMEVRFVSKPTRSRSSPMAPQVESVVRPTVERERISGGAKGNAVVQEEEASGVGGGEEVMSTEETLERRLIRSARGGDGLPPGELADSMP